MSCFDLRVKQCWRRHRRLKMRDWWESPHISLTARTSYAGRAYPAYLGHITQIFGDRKFAWDKWARCKGCMTRNHHSSTPRLLLPIFPQDNVPPRSLYHWTNKFFRPANCASPDFNVWGHLTPQSPEHKQCPPKNNLSTLPINLFLDGGGYAFNILCAALPFIFERMDEISNNACFSALVFPFKDKSWYH